MRWYDDHALLPSERAPGNQRRFFLDVLCQVAMIRAAQRVAFDHRDRRGALRPATPAGARHHWIGNRLAPTCARLLNKRIDELSR